MRIDYLKKRKTVEVRVPSADFGDPVLTHEDRRMRVVNEIAGEPRKLGNDLRGDVGAWRSVAASTPSPGEPRRAETKVHAPATLHGLRMTRG